MASRVVVVSEDNFTGHRWMYIQLLMKWAAQHQVTMHLLTVPGIDAGHRREAEELGVVVAERPDDSLQTLASYAAEVAADLVVVPDADQRAIQLGRGAAWHSTVPLRLLVMRAHAQSHGSRIALVGREALRRSLLAIASRRRGVDVKVLCSGIVLDPPSHLVPDPVEFAPAEQGPVELDPSVTWLGIIGAVDSRKNPLLVLQAADEASRRLGRPVGLLVAGRVVPELLAELESSEHEAPLVICNRRLDDAELDALVRDVDITVMAHGNDAPSGILAKSVRSGTKVLAAGSRVLRDDCREIGRGAVWTELDLDDLARGIAELATGPAPAARPLSSEAFCERLLG